MGLITVSAFDVSSRDCGCGGFGFTVWGLGCGIGIVGTGCDFLFNIWILGPPNEILI